MVQYTVALAAYKSAAGAADLEPLGPKGEDGVGFGRHCRWVRGCSIGAGCLQVHGTYCMHARQGLWCQGFVSLRPIHILHVCESEPAGGGCLHLRVCRGDLHIVSVPARAYSAGELHKLLVFDGLVAPSMRWYGHIAQLYMCITATSHTTQ